MYQILNVLCYFDFLFLTIKKVWIHYLHIFQGLKWKVTIRYQNMFLFFQFIIVVCLKLLYCVQSNKIKWQKKLQKICNEPKNSRQVYLRAHARISLNKLPNSLKVLNFVHLFHILRKYFSISITDHHQSWPADQFIL